MENKSIYKSLYRPLSDDQVESIHEASIELLERVGLTFEPDLKEFLTGNLPKSATIDTDKCRITFEKSELEKLISQAPDKIVLCSRDSKNDVQLYGDQVYFATGGTSTQFLDIDTGECRSSSLIDSYYSAMLVDKLKNIDLFTRLCTPAELPTDIYDINLVYAALQGTIKHINTAIFQEEALDQVLDLVSTVAGGKQNLIESPIISIHTTVIISPLKLNSSPVRIMHKAIKNQIPVSLGTAPMAGSSGPVTLAGTLTMMHAELMGAIAISQLIRPGAPVIYSAVPTRADMVTMNFLAGTIESGMMMAAAHQLARRIRIPNFVSGGWTDSKIPDAQAGWESAMTLLAAALGGGNCVRHAVGVIESAMTLSYEQFIISDEIIGMTKRMLKGIQVDSESIGLDVIKAVGPGNHFLEADHTLAHMRKEFYYGNSVTDCSSRHIWANKGGKDASMRARDLAQKILSETKNKYIDKDQDEKIRVKYDIRL
jgi:trimethylamine--corrinoid protein Co-methyltransferase